MPFSKVNISAAVNHLQAADPVMRRLIDDVGPFTLRARPDRFAMLVRIVSQQISTAAARTIRQRFEMLAAPEGLTAAKLASLSVEQLRSVGASQQKAAYLLDLARHVNEGDLDLRRIGRLSDEQVIEQLTVVKGIGRWTAQMFLIFSLGRLDVFPHDDLGVRAAIRNRYGLPELPDKQTSLTSQHRGDRTPRLPLGTAGGRWNYRAKSRNRPTAKQSAGCKKARSLWRRAIPKRKAGKRSPAAIII